jgi:peptide/nickel transport system substrate-binding protein
LDKIIIGPVAGWVIGAPKYMERLGWQEFLKRPVGTGPYMIQGLVKDYRNVSEGEVYATLIANPRYWEKGHPKISKIEFVRYSPKEAVHELVEGRIDLVTSIIPKDTLKIAESQYADVFKGRQDIHYTDVMLNLRSTHTLPLRDMRVRKALNYAVNRDELMRYAFKGNALKMKGMLTENSGVDLSETIGYEWNVPKARQLLKEAGYENGLKMKLYCDEKDYLIARLLQRFYKLLHIELEIAPGGLEWAIQHIVYPNTREGYSWEDEDWWLWVHSTPSHVPEAMGGMLGWLFCSEAPWRTFPDWVNVPLDRMYHEVLGSKERTRRFEIYKMANEYVADQALKVFTVAPLSLYGVNRELNFAPQITQYLYLDYSSVTENHWSVGGKNN